MRPPGDRQGASAQCGLVVTVLSDTSLLAGGLEVLEGLNVGLGVLDSVLLPRQLGTQLADALFEVCGVDGGGAVLDFVGHLFLLAWSALLLTDV